MTSQKFFAQQPEIRCIGIQRYAQDKPGRNHQSSDGCQTEEALSQQTLKRDPSGCPDLEEKGCYERKEIHYESKSVVE
jgi:hypothetical protein